MVVQSWPEINEKWGRTLDKQKLPTGNQVLFFVRIRFKNFEVHHSAIRFNQNFMPTAKTGLVMIVDCTLS